MLNTISYYASWAFAGLFGLVVPWWAWGLIGLAASIATFLFVPALVPERMRLALSGLVLMLGAILSAGSWGIVHGVHLERSKWEVKAARERLRLQMNSSRVIKNEMRRTAEAKAASEDLQRQLKELLEDDTPEEPAACAPPIIPESFARSVRGWKGHKR